MNRDRHATDPASARTATTQELRDRYLIDELFADGEVRTVHTAEDRMLVAGVVPGDDDLVLGDIAALGDGGLDRREFGVINLGTPGEVLVDGEPYALDHRDGLYAGRGSRLAFRGRGARFYVVTALAHTTHPTVHIPFAASAPLELGTEDGGGRRALHRYVWGDGDVASCQLQFGVTVLHPGAVWNTFPPHLHERRTEIYLYFELDEAARVVHLMGEPEHTRHLIVRNEEAVIAPRWSIHSGAGTGRYSFVWAMAGDNRDYGDLAPVPVEQLR
ncbi:5-dehydro-4-deoxy-D-glucuronate isomerase [Microbacterium terricola]|uniref:5-dehydro-4-deoxy-D-glucuronate isomerase n=1 Tax=Microbacterium terricola TaxID=344163 RepID=A0ABM8DWM7_9MICO|nr:5-dehydro-4-deoxy-D-glucuronate isomerase [Microbacterium terricola]UYK39380.1 5-dehydro-4-deoxy-D-glucuronate isomerase [Microbacterium terricola]BDV29896.1 4-deoxy-L-threo-5-hexosulose-uronate ketol-isomerase [Microbacterium terricola]